MTQGRKMCKKERDVRKLEELAAEWILLQERESAEAAARRVAEEPVETAVAHKRSRSAASTMPSEENVNTYIQEVNKGGASDEEMEEADREEVDLTQDEQARGP